MSDPGENAFGFWVIGAKVKLLTLILRYSCKIGISIIYAQQSEQGRYPLRDKHKETYASAVGISSSLSSVYYIRFNLWNNFTSTPEIRTRTKHKDFISFSYSFAHPICDFSYAFVCAIAQVWTRVWRVSISYRDSRDMHSPFTESTSTLKNKRKM